MGVHGRCRFIGNANIEDSIELGMTSANWLTLARLILALIAVFLMSDEIMSCGTEIAIMLFLIAVFLDKVDGVVARKFDCVTNLGKFLDTLVDKIVLGVFFLCLLDFQIIELQLVVAAVRSALDKNQPYDLILLDIVMPNMDGHDALKEIRKLEESEKGQLAGRTKIVMVTALSDIRNIIKSFKGLCDAYLLKPFDKNLLLVKLEELGLTSTIN